MAGEAGNVGGALWDREHGIPNGTTSSSSTATTPQAGTVSSSSSVSAPASSASSTSPATAAVPELMSERPKPGGGFPRIEDADRIPRSMEDMEAEAERYRKVLETMRIEEEEEKKKQTET
jgi:bis(5'-adenosyl)-triphosphatase